MINKYYKVLVYLLGPHLGIHPETEQPFAGLDLHLLDALAGDGGHLQQRNLHYLLISVSAGALAPQSLLKVSHQLALVVGQVLHPEHVHFVDHHHQWLVAEQRSDTLKQGYLETSDKIIY